MYKAVIIDDEPIIVTGLTRLLPWEKYNCQVAGTASDGQEGLELIRRIHPDIVFSDIYMPKMDGLLMTAALRSEYEDTELTILTGYRDFELVQEALRLGVTRFILKPSNMEELEEALQAMTAKLRKKGIFPDRQTSQGEARDVDSEGMADQGEARDVHFESMVDQSEERDMHSDRVDGQTGAKAEKTQESEGTGSPESNQIRQGTGAESPAGSFIVNNALAYMGENYHHKITLKDVADNTYVSQWHLSKLLNRHTGQSFSELLNSIRVEAAKELLKNPALRVGDVADEVGFQDLAHFSRVFKKITGVSANEYRNRL